jgi:hypothetical protein
MRGKGATTLGLGLGCWGKGEDAGVRVRVWPGQISLNLNSLNGPMGHAISYTCNCITIYILSTYCVHNLGDFGLYININIYGINCVIQLYRWNSWSLTQRAFLGFWNGDLDLFFLGFIRGTLGGSISGS